MSSVEQPHVAGVLRGQNGARGSRKSRRGQNFKLYWILALEQYRTRPLRLRHVRGQVENSFQFFFHTEKIKGRRIFHDISVHVSHVKTGVIFGVMPSKKNNSLVTPDEIMTPTFDSERWFQDGNKTEKCLGSIVA